MENLMDWSKMGPIERVLVAITFVLVAAKFVLRLTPLANTWLDVALCIFAFSAIFAWHRRDKRDRKSRSQ
jgi:hypothetical protein